MRKVAETVSRWSRQLAAASLPALALPCLLLGACDGRSAERPLVVLVTVDTLRADHVWNQTAGEQLAPRMQGFARAGALARDAFVPFGRTTQSVGTILTGRHPLQHGADGLGMALAEDVRTVAEVFAKAGYRTAAFTSNYFLRPGLGFDQGFDLYSCPSSRWEGNSASAITGEALAWLDSQREAEAPLFLWVHYLDPHWTYEPPRALARKFDPDWTEADESELQRRLDQANDGERIFQADRTLRPRDVRHLDRMYKAEVAATDAAIGRLLDGLDRMGLGSRSAVLLTADHGESLGEHRYWFAHGEYLYDATLRVPFAVRAPGLIPRGTELVGPVGLADVAPTLMGLAGLSGLEDGGGRNLTPLMRRGGRQQVPERSWVHLTDHRLVRDENPRRPVEGRPGRWWAIREGSLKLIQVPVGDDRHAVELYDTAEDPAETRDLSETMPRRARELEAVLERRRQALVRDFETTLDTTPRPGSEDLEMLRSLGYVQ
jgi:arylsulfatase A-like enzyme